MQTTDLIFGFTHQTVALAAMGLCYFLLFTEKLNRAVVTLLVGAGLVLCGAVSQEAAIAAIDFNTISLLTGMMIIINIAERTGMFQYVAVWGRKSARAPAGHLDCHGLCDGGVFGISGQRNDGAAGCAGNDADCQQA